MSHKMSQKAATSSTTMLLGSGICKRFAVKVQAHQPRSVVSKINTPISRGLSQVSSRA